MPIKKISYKQLLDTSENLFRINGYHRTSIDDIAKACLLRKSSIYHHIPSKTALVVEIVKNVINHFDQDILKYAYDTANTNQQRLVAYTAAVEEYYTKRQGGCLIGNLALETIDTLDELNALIQSFFKKWIAAVKEILLTKYTVVEAEKLAQDIVSQTQGAIMMSRIYHNFDALKSVNAHFNFLVTGKTVVSASRRVAVA